MKKSFLTFLSAQYFFVFILLGSWSLISCGSSTEQDQSKVVEALNTEEKPIDKEEKYIVFFGNSLTAGYGLDDPSLAFAGLIQKRLDSLGFAYKVVNAGVSGETTAGGNSRIDWLLKQPVDIFVLELGGNDGLRGIPVTDTRKNLQNILDKVKEKYPDAIRILAGMQIPPNMGQNYTQEFKTIYPELASKNNIPLIPFLLQGVGGEPSLNLPDGIHPNLKGHQIVRENVWEVLEPLL